MRPRSDGSAAPTGGSSGAAGADELARENRRLRNENRRLRERLDAERSERQAVIDRYEGLVDESDAGASGSGPSRRRATVSPGASRPSVLDRLARFLGLR